MEETLEMADLHAPVTLGGQDHLYIYRLRHPHQDNECLTTSRTSRARAYPRDSRACTRRSHRASPTASSDGRRIDGNDHGEREERAVDMERFQDVRLAYTMSCNRGP